MQVTAYQIVKAFGIDALGKFVTANQVVKTFGIDALNKFHSFENQEEIAQARYEWAQVHETMHCIDSFNDGNNVWEVIFNVETMMAYRTDCNVDVTAEYQEAIGTLCAKLDRYAENFGLERESYLIKFVKSMMT